MDTNKDDTQSNDDNVNTKPNEDLLPFMSEVERQALVGDTDDSATLAKVMEGLRSVTEDDDNDENSAGSVDHQAGEQTAADETAPAVQKVETQGVTVEAPAVTATAIENLDAQIAELDAQKAAQREAQIEAEEKLREKLESADLEPEDYRRQLKELRLQADQAVEALADKRRDLLDQDKEYKRQVNAQTEFYKNQWISDSNAFLAQAKAQGIDYTNAATPLLGTALNTEIARINQAHPEYTNKQVLEAAHKSVIEQFNLKPRTSGKAKPTIPPNIGNLPAASQSNDEGAASRFAKLDRVSGIDLERELAKMTDDERDAWLASE